MSVSKGRLLADPSTPLDGDSVVAYLRDGSGNAINSTSNALHVLVQNVDLDIRDLTHASDSVRIGDGTDFLAINNDGSINVNASFTAVFNEDDPHATGDDGVFMLSVRQDVPAASTSADGDYQALKGDNLGRAWVNSGANVAVANASVSVTTTSGALLSSPLASRRFLKVQNNGNKAIALGASGVTFSNGWIIPAGASDIIEAGPGIAIHAVAQSGTQDVRVLELA